MTLEIISENRSFDGIQGVYKHQSELCACDMTFAVYMPPQAAQGPVPVLWFLSGLTCTHENAMIKAGAQAYASKHGLALVFADTSPRGDDIVNDDAYDLGQGAGFYVDATEPPWAAHFQMYSYITQELPTIIAENFNIDMTCQGITGHSMGGHGALCIALRNPHIYTSVSAFSPICNPTQSNWGKKQFSAYIGPDQTNWAQYDATLLLQNNGWDRDILVHTGGDDQFANLLGTHEFQGIAKSTDVDLTLHQPDGYDHSYFFIATFMERHIAWHAERLQALKTAKEGVVLLHGFGRTSLSMAPLEWRLRAEGYKTLNHSYPSLRKDLPELVDDIHANIAEFSGDVTKIHFIGHSLGGLLTRAYIKEYRPDNLGRVVQLASPNKGSAVADFFYDYAAFRFASGPVNKRLKTTDPERADILGTIDYPLGAIAGSSSSDIFKTFVHDGKISDGTVTVQSAHPEGASDTTTKPIRHSIFPMSKTAADLAIKFLKSGKF